MKRKQQPRPRLNPILHVIRAKLPSLISENSALAGKIRRSLPRWSWRTLTSTSIGVLRLWQLTYTLTANADTEDPQTFYESRKKWASMVHLLPIHREDVICIRKIRPKQL